jgi:outer membrane lipoprotein SlyB
MAQLRQSLILLLAIGLAIPALGQRTARRDRHTTIAISYGEVVEFEEVKLKSTAAQGAALGGLAGLAGSSSHHAARDAAAGAALGALLAQALTKHKANAYTVRLADGSVVKVIVDHQEHLRVGDCVSVEEGNTTNLRLVEASLCQGTNLHDDPQVAESHQGDAEACQAAKQQLLESDGEDEFNRALEKVKVLCH